MIDVSRIPVREFVEVNTTRLISTAYMDEPALVPLIDDEDELGFLEKLEGLSSSRSGLPEFIPDGIHPDELVTRHHGYGWTYINAAFCHTRETGNRFNGPQRGAWYAAWREDRIETAQAEVVWHLSRELEATGIFENKTAWRELHASFANRFHDLSDYAGEAFLDPDLALGYPHGQRLASEALASGSNGFLFSSVRRAGGSCLVAFRPHIIQNIRSGDTWVFEWAGAKKSDPAVAGSSILCSTTC